MPLKIEFIETPEKVNEILGKLEELAGTGIIDIQETTIAKPAQVPKPKSASPSRSYKDGGQGQDDADLHRRIGSMERQASLPSPWCLSAWRRPLKNGPGNGGRTHDLAIIDRVLCQLSYPWIRTFELVPGAGVEPA
jgi:hypothetical protein